MDSFAKFVISAKEAMGNQELFEEIHIVIGNESCDMDSTVSALGLAFLIRTKKAEKKQLAVLPVMNVASKFFPLRTETCHVLSQAGLCPENLIFKDQIDIPALIGSKKVRTSLVDHHVLAKSDKVLEETVVQIFDHRPINFEEICRNHGVTQSISIVGSCATLVAHKILGSKLPILNKDLSNLLYATIVYDTIGLNKDHGKTFDEDIAAAEALENSLGIQNPLSHRKLLFEQLWKIHNDISSLKTGDLLFRDLKMVQNVAIPGLPLLVEEYLKREDAGPSVKCFAEDLGAPLVVLIGIDAARDVLRDLAIFYKDAAFKEILVDLLNTTKDSSGAGLDLQDGSCVVPDTVCFKQNNIKLTRKFILPIVNEAVKKYCAINN